MIKGMKTYNLLTQPPITRNLLPLRATKFLRARSKRFVKIILASGLLACGGGGLVGVAHFQCIFDNYVLRCLFE